MPFEGKRRRGYCPHCGWEGESQGLKFDCPMCGAVASGHIEVKCCGEWLVCMGFTNTCETCGADYNWSGQQLAPRSQWGEETGESLADILSIE
jgi:hypothetical protein